MNKTIIAIIGLAASALLLPGPAAQAEGLQGSSGKEVCSTGTEYDTPKLKYSLRRFVDFFNKEPVKQFCKDAINIQHDITLEEPIVLTGSVPAAGKSLSIDNQSFKYGLVINGTDPDTGTPHILYVDKIRGKCAIRVATSNVLIRNLVIMGKQSVTSFDAEGNVVETETADAEQKKEKANPNAIGNGITTGVCIDGNDNALSRVIVNNIDGKGIVVTSQGNVIGNGTASYRNADIGIEVGQTGNGSTLVPSVVDPGFQPFNRLNPHIILYGNGEKTQAKQLVVQDNTVELQMQGTGADGEYDVYGVVRVSGQARAPYLMVFYKVQPDLEIDATALKITDVAIGYLVSPGATPVGLPTDLTPMPNGALDESGNFSFHLSNTKESSTIFAVIFPYKDVIASASKTYLISGFTWGDGISGDLTGGFGGAASSATHLFSKEACVEVKGPGKTTPINGIYDSDDDGIADYLEDTSFNCQGDTPVETDLRNADSDGDGVPDGREDRNQNGFVDCFMPESSGACGVPSANGVNVPVYQSRSVGGVTYCLVQPGYLLDFNKKILIPGTGKFPIPDPSSMTLGVPAGFDPAQGFCEETNPRDSDSDEDSLFDGEEDRSATFQSYQPETGNPGTPRKAHYYYLESTGQGAVGGSYVKDAAGQPIECTLLGDNAIRLGIQYVFGWTPPATNTAPATGMMGKPAMVNVVCKNETVTQTDFNGTFDKGHGETDPRNPDTDGDLLCDGNGCGGLTTNTIVDGVEVSQPISGFDPCPDNPEPTCLEQCWNGKIIGQLPSSLTYSQVLAELKTATMAQKDFLITLGGAGLKDSDGDNIPDIVENTKGACGPGLLGFDPTKADTDNDGIIDSQDACPTIHNPENDCTPQAIQFSTKDAPIMACYIDRDGDGLFDCEEDLNLNGKLDALAGESSPFDTDTNDNALSDKDEYDAGITPGIADQDSDGDGIPDVVEMNRHGDPRKYDKTGGAGLSCAEGVVKMDLGMFSAFDTDPKNADTDSDGIVDGKEVKYGYNPNNPDSDTDGLCDGGINVPAACTPGIDCVCLAGEDMNGDGKTPLAAKATSAALPFLGDLDESDPCASDTDADGKSDAKDECKNIAHQSCTAQNAMGFDSDLDGIPDLTELTVTGTKPDDDDSDGDGLIDGCSRDADTGEVELGTGELCNQVKKGKFTNTFETHKVCGPVPYTGCDTNPNSADTDGDKVSDSIERRFPTNPRNQDTDGDCLGDAVEMGKVTVDAAGIAVLNLSTIDGEYTGCTEQDFNGKIGLICTELNPNDQDTDKDGIPDGKVGLFGEDQDCNGVVNKDATGLPTETSPLTWDSDGDGFSDYQEMTEFGGFNAPGNLNRALSGQGQGCSLVAGNTPRQANNLVLMLLLGLPLLALGRARKTVQ